MSPYDPLEALRDKELIKLVLEAAEDRFFNRHEMEQLKELIRRFDALVERAPVELELAAYR